MFVPVEYGSAILMMGRSLKFKRDPKISLEHWKMFFSSSSFYFEMIALE